MGKLTSGMIGLLVFMVMISLSAGFMSSLADKNSNRNPGDKLQTFDQSKQVMGNVTDFEEEVKTEETSNILSISKMASMMLNFGKTILSFPGMFENIISDAVTMLELPNSVGVLLRGIIIITFVMGVIKLIVG